MNKTALTNMKLNELIKKRWSPRAFSDKIPTNEDIGTILEAARWSASCNNEQPWRILVGIKNQNEVYQNIFDVLAEGNQVWTKSAPVLIMIYAKKTFSRNDKPNNWAEYDTGQAAAHMSIQAMDLNIYVHQMAGFKPDAAIKLISSEEDLIPITAMALGFLGNPEQLPEGLKKAEQSERKRKNLDEIVLEGSFAISKFS
jgi:nitroreductase